MQVPSATAYSSEQTARKDAAKLIEQAWKCAVHQGICFVTASLEHIQIHDVRLAQWASAVVCYLFYLSANMTETLL